MLSFFIFSLAYFSNYSLASVSQSINIEEAWIREVPPIQKNTTAFLKISNLDSKTHYIVKVESLISKKNAMYLSVQNQGYSKTRPVKKIPLAPHSKTELKLGTYHIMFIKLNNYLNSEDIYELKLIFEDKSIKTVKMQVKRT